jgi:DNA-binding response OmpR family regulator
VAAALRRSQIAPVATRQEPIEVPGLVIDPDQQRAFLLGEEGTRTDAQLTPTEFRLLLVLAENAGRAMSRDELQQRVWNVPHRPRDRSVDVCVRKLREKIDHKSAYTYVETHFGVGYRFAPEPV